MMEGQTLTKILDHLAEAAFPPETDLWPNIRLNLETSQISMRDRGVLKRARSQNRTLRLAAGIAAVLLLLAALVFATPQGQAWAKNLLRFFIPSGADVRPLPTVPVVLYEVTPGSPVPTPTTPAEDLPAFYSTCGVLPDPNCSIEQIKEMVDFEVKGLPDLPLEMRFAGATGGPERIWIDYRCIFNRCGLILTEEPWTGSLPEDSPRIGSSAAVEQVRIGELPGEYVRGAWFTGAENLTWDPDSGVQTLRWVDGEVLYQLMAVGVPDSPEIEFDKAGLVALARTLTDAAAGPEQAFNPSYLKTIEEAQALAGFEVLEPAALPAGYTFGHASYSAEQNSVCLHYTWENDALDSTPLHIVESPTSPLPQVEEVLNNGNSENAPESLFETETLPVGGAQDGLALYIWGGLAFGSQCGVPDLYAGSALLWSSNGMQFQIYAPGIPEFESYLSQLDLVRLAESLTGVVTIPDDQLDPERLNSPEEAITLAGFDVKVPSKLPPGADFSRASYDEARRSVLLVYHDLSIVETLVTDQTGTDLDIYPPEAIEHVTVGGVPAFYVQGCWSGQNGPENWDRSCANEALIWEDGGIEYSIWANLYVGTAKETLIGVAESLK